MEMDWKLQSWFVVMVSLYLVGCEGTMYTVGDSSGWDISTDLDSWVHNKTFLVGDSLLFQFSSYHSLVELQRPDFESCNTTNLVLEQSNTTSGNTTVPLTEGGDRFFSCGNSLHCLGGMKLQIHTTSNQSTAAVQPSSVQAAGPTSSSSLLTPSIANDIPSSSSSSRLPSTRSYGYPLPSCFMLLLAFLINV